MLRFWRGRHAPTFDTVDETVEVSVACESADQLREIYQLAVSLPYRMASGDPRAKVVIVAPSEAVHFGVVSAPGNA